MPPDEFAPPRRPATLFFGFFVMPGGGPESLRLGLPRSRASGRNLGFHVILCRRVLGREEVALPTQLSKQFEVPAQGDLLCEAAEAFVFGGEDSAFTAVGILGRRMDWPTKIRLGFLSQGFSS